MDMFTVYKLPNIPEPVLFVPPPYCRKANKKPEDLSEEFKETPGLKLLISNPSKLLLLYESLNDNSSKALEVKINNYLMKEADCKSVFLLHLEQAAGEAIVQTLGREMLETSLRFTVSKELIDHLIQYENKSLKCDENLNSEIFRIFNEMFGGLSYKIIAVPILPKQKFYPCSTKKLRPLLLTCFVDSTKCEDYVINLTNELFKYCLPVLLNIVKAEEEARQKQLYQTLLGIMRTLFSNLGNFNKVMKTMVEEARRATHAKKCILYLTNVDHVELISNVFKSFDAEEYVKIKAAKDYAIADHVVNTGRLLNMDDTSCTSLTQNSLPECADFAVKNILCFPIKYNDEIIGAFELCNKRVGNFNHFDEEVVNVLSTFYGISVTHSFKHAKHEICKIRNQQTNELMLSHVQVNADEVNKRVTCPLIHSYPGFDQFNFYPRTILERETICFVLKMFEDLGFFTSFSIKKCIFTKFVICVKKSCRDVPYHNWMHLFSASHFAYLCVKNLQLVERSCITQLESLAYFLSCLCHDVDYRGTRNPFQEDNNDLASLYSSSESTMERHRLSQILRILNMEGCNFLDVLDREAYYLILNLMKDFILATDLAAHFKFYKKQYNMVKEGYQRNNAEHRFVFTTLLITCADLSDHTKDGPFIKNIALNMHEEFLNQSSLRKQNLSEEKISSLETALLPDLQIKFLREICLPVFKLLAALFKSTKELVRQIKKNILYWECSKHIFEKAVAQGLTFEEVLASETFDKNVEDTMHLLEKDKS